MKIKFQVCFLTNHLTSIVINFAYLNTYVSCNHLCQIFELTCRFFVDPPPKYQNSPFNVAAHPYEIATSFPISKTEFLFTLPSKSITKGSLVEYCVPRTRTALLSGDGVGVGESVGGTVVTSGAEVVSIQSYPGQGQPARQLSSQGQSVCLALNSSRHPTSQSS